MSKSDLMNLTVVELTEKLRDRGLSKDDFVARLLETTQGETEEKTNKKQVDTSHGDIGETSKEGTTEQSGNEEKPNMDETKDAAEKSCSEKCLPGDNPFPNRRFGKARHEMISCHEVERLLGKLGVDPEKASNCIKAAIMRGHINIKGEEGDLDMVVHQEKGPWCGHMIQAKLGDLLEQPDYAGLDYEDGCQEATVVCGECDEDDWEGRTYVTQLCVGQGRLDNGKFHNHCVKCPGFGICIGDYRNSHCNRCGDHPFVGSGGHMPSCNNCGNPDVHEDDCKMQ